MESSQESYIESQLDSYAKTLPFIHCIWLVCLLALSYYKPQWYKQAEEVVCMLGLITAVIINKTYIRKGKELEEVKELTEIEKKYRKNEYLMRFFPAYVIWPACYILVSQ